MALLYLLNREGFANVVVCHLNHGLRGRASVEDGRFVKKVAEKMGYVVEVGKVDLKKQMEASGDALELAGRKARHDFFGDCGQKYRCGGLLLAHHADDQAETVLWNLMRGSAACVGIRARRILTMGGRKILVERPLLHLRKARLVEWMMERGFKWREDASNGVSDVVRNRLRNEVFPLLDAVARRDVRPMFSRAAVVSEGHQEVMEWALQKAHVLDPQGRLHLGVLRELPVGLQFFAMADFLRSRGVGDLSQGLVERCVAMADVKNTASVNLPGGGRMRRRGGRIFLESA